MDREPSDVVPHDSHKGRATRLDPEMQNPQACEEEKKALSSNRVSFLQRIDHFTWAWFTLTMSTGGIALLLSVQPHTFRGLDAIGKIVFIFDLVLFVLLVSAITTRFIRTPRRIRDSFQHPTEGLFFPTFFLSVSTILGGMQRYGVPSTGVWLTVTLRVLFWIYVATTFVSSVFQYWVLFTGKQLTVQSMTPSWLLPIFPVMLCGTVASLISPTQPEVQRTAILVAGLTFQGLGFWVAILVYGVYISRLMESGLPGPNLRPGMFIAVGPPSFTALALIGMSKSIPAEYGYFATHPDVVSMLQQLALAFGVFIWSLSFWFFSVTLVSVVLTIPHMTFHLTWWAFVFPNVGFTIAIIQIGEGLESNAITWVGSILTIILVAVYLFVLGAHIKAVLAKDIMWPGKDEDKDE
ncbi:MAG: hypothetical protein M1821_009550 [Bathelium mastoideum]|nr:MAG: hypothetical protein M1821_009550 [Bathelium mastoideum]KAI9688773.1 MAG: hypothetical protein M1822_001130 [Bathelium mastoideum]